MNKWEKEIVKERKINRLCVYEKEREVERERERERDLEKNLFQFVAEKKNIGGGENLLSPQQLTISFFNWAKCNKTFFDLIFITVQ